ncbi:putative sucrose-phosphate synthase 4 [Camellia lanceoleosa]|nr:putative sucrose-phosphate synthase 4 [Camellia lanceoleosa]
MRGLRCNIVYTHAASRLNVVPLFASRAQTLRYLSVRWGIDLSKMVVFVGERGDTDYEDLLVGLHKTVILRNSVEFGSEMLLRSEESFKREDVVPQVSPSIAFIEGHEAHDISAALKALQIM